MLYVGDTIYAATGGGLMVIPNQNSAPQTFVNTDGLGTTDLTDIIEDQASQKWIAGFGQLIKWSRNSVRRFPFTNEDGPDRLTALADDGDQLWVGTEKGLVLFSKTIDDGQFQDRFSITLVNSFPVINDIYIDGNNIWLATSTGLARGDKRFPNLLKSPANWQLFNSASDPILIGDPITRVMRFESILFFGTPEGIFYIADSLGDSTIVHPAYGIDRAVYDMRNDNDTLFFYQVGGVRRYVQGNVANIPTAGLSSNPNTGVNTGTMRWFGLVNGGLFYTEGSGFVSYQYMGLPHSEVTDVAINTNGVVAAGFGVADRLGILNDDEWTTYSTVRDFTTKLARDSSGAFWTGTWGNGLYQLQDSVLVNYDETNSSLRGIAPTGGSATYVVVRDIACDARYVYAATFLAYNGCPVAIGRLDSLQIPAGWDSLGTADGITDTRVSSIDVWNNVLAVGTEDNGLFFYSFGATRATKADDSSAHLTENSAFLISNNVRAVRFNSHGELWVGTSFGLSRYDAGIERFVDVNLPAGFGPEVLSLAFDVRDNIWVGSSNGIARIDITTGAIDVFTTQNSGLLSNQVNTVTIELPNNNLYVATDLGISVLLFEAELTGKIDKVLAYPNPFVIRDATDRLRFNYAGKGTVQIFNEASDPITEFPVNLPWDGRNSYGNNVASGVYLFIINSESGEVGRGKFLVIR